MMDEMEVALWEERLPEDGRGLQEIAQSINEIKAQVRNSVMEGSIRIGQELQAAKSKVPYGEWGDWLENNVDYSVRTAQNLMRIADEYGRRRTEAMENLSITQAVLLLGLPAGEREAFVEEHDMASISTDELKEQIRQLNEEKSKMQLTISELMETVATQNEETVQQEYAKAQAEAEAKAQALADELEEVRRKLEAADGEKQKELKAQAAELEKARQEARQAATKAAADREKIAGLERTQKRLEEELTTERAKTPEVVKETPAEVLRELEQLRAQAGRGQSETELRAAYDSVKDSLERLRDKLEAVSRKEPEVAAKYGPAFGAALRKAAEMMEKALIK